MRLVDCPHHSYEHRKSNSRFSNPICLDYWSIGRYHVQTKHHFNRYARALGHLIGRINLIRFGELGAPVVALPLLKITRGAPVARMTRSINLERFLVSRQCVFPFQIFRICACLIRVEKGAGDGITKQSLFRYLASNGRLSG